MIINKDKIFNKKPHYLNILPEKMFVYIEFNQVFEIKMEKKSNSDKEFQLN